MNRQAQVADLLLVNRVCRGKSVLTSEQSDELFTQLATQTDLDKAKQWLTGVFASHGANTQVVSDAASLGDLSSLVTALAYMHYDNCGYDINQVLVRYPFDGAQRTITCPSCSSEHVVIFPLYE